MERPPEIEPIRWLMLSLYVPACLLGLWWLLSPEQPYANAGPSPWSVVGFTPQGLELQLQSTWDGLRLLSAGLGLAARLLA